ncbi:RAS protein activator like-3 [Ahaetulla prasina]|uniref:RAS protein activator like-3 n=1 Tax=Ahaetulla prasina TaxID=499056 RepID=UPI00264929E5|nr:RAS protein activator like-3 [Ahaetulla prasina]
MAAQKSSLQKMAAQLETEGSTLLKAYLWQTVLPTGEKVPELGPIHYGSESSRGRRKIQKWKQVQSQPESEVPEPGHNDLPLLVSQDSRVATKRSIFQRAFSLPGRMSKAQERSSKLSVKKYLRSMSHWKNQEGPSQTVRETKETSKGDDSVVQLIPSMGVRPWDVANVSLQDRRLTLWGRDEENLLEKRKRTSSSVSENNSIFRPHKENTEFFIGGPAPEKKAFQDASSGTQLGNVKGMLWRRFRGRKVLPNTDSSGESVVNDNREAFIGPALTLDLNNEKDVLIRPLHSSLVGKQHCFEVLRAGERYCFNCSSAAERTHWMENLRQAIQPSMDNWQRMEHRLSLWVYEARDLSPRKHYHCEIQLDGVLYARTTVKQASPIGTLFWGEHFDLKTLPPAVELQVCLIQEEEGLWPKESPNASMSVPLKELAAKHQPLERWYPLGKEKPNMPTLRLRGRYCNFKVLPIVQYKEFAEYLTFHYRELCASLEPSLSARDKEELMSVLVRVLQSTGKAKDFLIDLGIAELDRFDDREALIFRENTLATKAIDEYMKLVGSPYLLATLSDIITQPNFLEDCCEVDPSKCPPRDLADNRNHLQKLCEEVFLRIAMSSNSFPAELNEIFTAWQEACQLRGKVDIGQRLVSASLFLRFLCPAIMSPSLFGLTQKYPDDTTSRTLTLVAKVIQNLANFTTFGEKEAYMSFMNEFLEHNWYTMKSFLSCVSSPGSTIALSAYNDSIDLALELSILHSLLCSIFSTLEQQTQEKLQPLPAILQAIQEGTPVPVSILLGPHMEERHTEKQKVEFVPPRDLDKYSPLIKSQSMTSIQKNKGKEEALTPLYQTKTRSKVQRTQSVPTQTKASRRLHKQSSIERVVDSQDSNPQPYDFSLCNGGSSKASQGCSKLHPSVSLPQKPSVPWLRHSEDTSAMQNCLYPMQPLEQYARQMEVLQMKLSSARDKQQLLEEQVKSLSVQNQALLQEQARFQEQEEILGKRVEETELCLVQLSSRVSCIEASWKKDHEKLQVSEEKTKQLDLQFSRMERDHDQLFRAVSQMLGYRDNQPHYSNNSQGLCG